MAKSPPYAPLDDWVGAKQRKPIDCNVSAMSSISRMVGNTSTAGLPCNKAAATIQATHCLQ